MTPHHSQVRAYLSGLPSATRTKLTLALERARRDGKLGQVESFLLDELREIAAGEASADARAAFFGPLEPYLVDEEIPTKLAGRIARRHLERIWTWLSREVIPVEILAYQGEVAEIRADGEAGAEARRLAARKLLAAAIEQLRERLAEAHRAAEIARKIAAYVGGPRAYTELEDISGVLTERERLEQAAASLPAEIDLGDADQAALVTGLVQRAGGPYASYLAVLIHQRVTHPAGLAALAAAGAQTGDVKVVAASPFAPLVAIVLSDVERAVERMLAELDRPDGGRDVAGDLRDYNATARQLRAAIDLDDYPSDWGKRLTDARTRLSTRLARELAELPPLLRRSVRSMRSFGQRNPVAPDPIDVSRVCALIVLFDVARLASGELALNELVARMRGDIELYVEGLANALADELRSVGGNRRDIVLEHAASAVRVHEALYGATHAAVVRRSFEVAGSTSLAPQLAATGT